MGRSIIDLNTLQTASSPQCCESYSRRQTEKKENHMKIITCKCLNRMAWSKNQMTVTKFHKFQEQKMSECGFSPNIYTLMYIYITNRHLQTSWLVWVWVYRQRYPACWSDSVHGSCPWLPEAGPPWTLFLVEWRMSHQGGHCFLEEKRQWGS